MSSMFRGSRTSARTDRRSPKGGSTVIPSFKEFGMGLTMVLGGTEPGEW